MKPYRGEAAAASVRPVPGAYLQTRYHLDRTPVEITVGMGGDWSPLACKEVYGKAVKTVLELELDSCVFDLTPAAALGEAGLWAMAEGVYGGAYRQRFALTGACAPEIDCYAAGAGWTEPDLAQAIALARRVLQVRNLVNRPGNLLTPAAFSDALAAMAAGLPVEVERLDEAALEARGLNALLAVGKGSGPQLAILRYTGAPGQTRRLGLVGKGVTCDSGGYCLKPGGSMEGIKGDMAGGAAAAAAVCALAENGVAVNVTAVVPICENRIAQGSLLPGDLITTFSGRTVEVLNTDAEGRLILCDALTWAIREERVTHLADIATLTGAIYALLGHVAAGVMASGDSWYGRLEQAAALSGERYWRLPAFPEYEKLLESELADLRNVSKDGCGAVTAGLFLRHFTEGLPWLHLDIAGTADGKSPLWQHQTGGATGAAVSTLYHLAAGQAVRP